MKWSPEKCLPGDMIRIRLGSFCHYGIYVSDEEVIQFGLPPVGGLPKNGDGIRVLSTDIDTFSCGKIVEVGVPERAGGEKRRRFSAKKTVENARARLGEGGYNVLHNNCEHFVWECAFGEEAADPALSDAENLAHVSSYMRDKVIALSRLTGGNESGGGDADEK